MSSSKSLSICGVRSCWLFTSSITFWAWRRLLTEGKPLCWSRVRTGCKSVSKLDCALTLVKLFKHLCEQVKNEFGSTKENFAAHPGGLTCWLWNSFWLRKCTSSRVELKWTVCAQNCNSHGAALPTTGLYRSKLCNTTFPTSRSCSWCLPVRADTCFSSHGMIFYSQMRR